MIKEIVVIGIPKPSSKIGIVGFGGFGRFAANILGQFFDVTVTDIFPPPDNLGEKVRWGSLPEAASCDIVILAINLGQLEGVLQEISQYLKPRALVVDVCSVKIKPIELMQRLLPPDIEVLATHPLFGPQSAKNGLSGHKIVLCPVRVSDETMAQVKSKLMSMGLEVVESDAENHDQEMAWVQGLTHFIARAMIESGVRTSPLSTRAYESLLGVLNTLNPGSWELFQTIELGNPYATEIRRRFIEELENLERRLAEE